MAGLIVTITLALMAISVLIMTIIMVIPPKKDKELQKRQEMVNLFCDLYKATTGEKVHITVAINQKYKYIINKEDQ